MSARVSVSLIVVIGEHKNPQYGEPLADGSGGRWIVASGLHMATAEVVAVAMNGDRECTRWGDCYRALDIVQEPADVGLRMRVQYEEAARWRATPITNEDADRHRFLVKRASAFTEHAELHAGFSPPPENREVSARSLPDSTVQTESEPQIEQQGPSTVADSKADRATPGLLPEGDREPLSEAGRIVYEHLIALPGYVAKSEKELIRVLEDAGTIVHEGRVRNGIKKELTPYGLKSKKGVGYYIPLSARPKGDEAAPRDA